MNTMHANLTFFDFGASHGEGRLGGRGIVGFARGFGRDGRTVRIVNASAAHALFAFTTCWRAPLPPIPTPFVSACLLLPLLLPFSSLFPSHATYFLRRLAAYAAHAKRRTCCRGAAARTARLRGAACCCAQRAAYPRCAAPHYALSARVNTGHNFWPLGQNALCAVSVKSTSPQTHKRDRGCGAARAEEMSYLSTLNRFAPLCYLYALAAADSAATPRNVYASSAQRRSCAQACGRGWLYSGGQQTISSAGRRRTASALAYRLADSPRWAGGSRDLKGQLFNSYTAAQNNAHPGEWWLVRSWKRGGVCCSRRRFISTINGAATTGAIHL